MVAYDVNDRYANCAELADDLERALVGCGESSVGVAGINVLVVEDSQTDMLLAIKMLKRLNSTLSIHQARTLACGLEICGHLPINLALLDLSLPDSSGVATVSRFRETMPQLPLVVLTGMSQDEVGSACLQAGADTFISKSSLTPHRMERMIFVTLSRCGLRSFPSSRQPDRDQDPPSSDGSS
jgi:sigma-B regulation protein RsbU (phosphoserine phosphatase)